MDDAGFKFVGRFENTQLVPDAYLKTKDEPFPRHVVLVGPINSIPNIIAAAKRWILSTEGITKTATIFVLDLDSPVVPNRVLINSLAFQKGYGLSDDEIRTLYGNIQSLATHIVDWYFEHSPLKLGGEYICKILTLDQDNYKCPVTNATFRFSAREFEVLDVSTRDKWGQPIFELEGEVLNLNELVLLLQSRVESEANRIAIYVACWKLGKLGISQHSVPYVDPLLGRRFNPLAPDYHERLFDEEFERTIAGKR